MISSQMNATLNNVALVTQPSNCPAQFVPQPTQISTADIAQFYSFQIAPDAFIWIEVRRIAGQLLQLYALCAAIGQKVLDRLPTVDRRTVPDHQQLALNMAQQMLQKAHNLRAAVGPLLRLVQQFAVHRDAADRRDALVSQGDAQDRRLANRGIGTHNTGQQRKARLIYPDNGSPVNFRPFFSSGQRSAYHAAILASSRWVARRIGFWELQPMARKRRLT